MKISVGVLSLFLASVVPAIAEHNTCKVSTSWVIQEKFVTQSNVITKTKTFTKSGPSQVISVKKTITTTVTVTAGGDTDQPEAETKATAVTKSPPKAGNTCPPSSIITDATRSCPGNGGCKKCRSTTTVTSTYGCKCMFAKDGPVLQDFKMKCPDDCSCTTFTQWLPDRQCTEGKKYFVTAVA
ncbi:hypothetical protein ABW20_dc0101056 [Dactylellina cionopaga]|nr:hypothetical protein ABW20_dc0101056 [Dactylellina cionopaga]